MGNGAVDGGGAAAPRARAGLEPSDIVQAGLLIALLAVSAQVTLAVGPIPFTLQTLAVVLAALAFTPGQAALALAGYILLGAFGLPVFSAMRGGLAVLVGPTGGYIYGFALSAVLGCLVRRAVCPPSARAGHARRSCVADVLAGVVAVAVCYAVGTAHFVLVSAAAGSPVNAAYALGVCVAPFVLPDAAKVAAAVAVARSLRRAVPSVARR